MRFVWNRGYLRELSSNLPSSVVEAFKKYQVAAPKTVEIGQDVIQGKLALAVARLQEFVVSDNPEVPG